LRAGEQRQRDRGLHFFLARQITAVGNYGGESAVKILPVARAILAGAPVAAVARACAFCVFHSLCRDLHANKLYAQILANASAEVACPSEVPLLCLVRRREAGRQGDRAAAAARVCGCTFGLGGDVDGSWRGHGCACSAAHALPPPFPVSRPPEQAS
jgi:hypothetical protein